MKRPLCCVCTAFVAIVFLYLQLNPIPDKTYDYADGSKVTLCGQVSKKEYQSDALVLYLSHIRDSDTISKVLCYMEPQDMASEPKSGSIVVVEGKVSYFNKARNPGGFDARKYYQILGVDFRFYDAKVIACSSTYSRYWETLYRIRSFFEKIFDEIFTSKDASVMKAVLLGRKSELDADSRLLFQKSGMAHIFAISGLHITILGIGFFKLLRKTRIPQALCVLIAVWIMISYGDMTGMSSSAYRAVFMFAMQLMAQLLKRTCDMLTSLALAAVLLLAEQPLYLYHSGFLLSFGAILGIGCFGDIIRPEKARVKKGLKFGPVWKIKLSLCGSLSIFLVHFPIMLCEYYTFPVYSFLLNLIIIPAMTLLTGLGAACLFFGSLPAAAGIGTAKVIGVLCHILLLFFEQLCRISLRLPFAEWIAGRPDSWRIYVYAVVLCFLYVMHRYGRYLSKQRDCEERGVSIGLTHHVKLMIILAAVVLVSDSSIDGASMTFLDVGQGDCIWVESAKGEHFLIDAGSTSESKVGQYTLVPYLKYMGVSRIDAVFLTHLDKDHISGVLEMIGDSSGIADGILIDRICISDAVIEDEAYEELRACCKAGNIPLYRMKAGDKITAHDLCIEVMHPQSGYEADSRNAYSLVMKLEFGQQAKGKKTHKVTALLTGDVQADGERKVSDLLAGAADDTGIDIYKASHHGSKYSNTAELLEAASPQLSIISCGKKNSYGHPHAEVIERLGYAGSDIMITKDTGAIRIQIKKGTYKVFPYNKE